MLMALIYYSKEKGAWGEVWEIAGTSSQGPLPVELRRICLISKSASVVTAQMKCYQLGSSIETQGPEFLGGATM